MRDEDEMFENAKKKLKIIAVFVGLLIMIIGMVVFYGYSSATQKYKQDLAEKDARIAELVDVIATYENASKEVNISVINSEIKEIGELATIEYIYTDAGKFSDPAQFFGKDIPFSITTKTFIAKWDGCIKAGVNVEEIVVDVNKLKKEIVIHIPKAEILSHELDDESFETLGEKDGLFNPIKIDDIRKFDTVCKENMEKRAIENGILEKALENAKEIIYKLINTDVVEKQGYIITFEVIED